MEAAIQKLLSNNIDIDDEEGRKRLKMCHERNIDVWKEALKAFRQALMLALIGCMIGCNAWTFMITLC